MVCGGHLCRLWCMLGIVVWHCFQHWYVSSYENYGLGTGCTGGDDLIDARACISTSIYTVGAEEFYGCLGVLSPIRCVCMWWVCLWDGLAHHFCWLDIRWRFSVQECCQSDGRILSLKCPQVMTVPRCILLCSLWEGQDISTRGSLLWRFMNLVSMRGWTEIRWKNKAQCAWYEFNCLVVLMYLRFL